MTRRSAELPSALRQRSVAELDALEGQLADRATAVNQASWPGPAETTQARAAQLRARVADLETFRTDADARARLEGLQAIASRLHAVDRRRLRLLLLSMAEPTRDEITKRVKQLESDVLASSPPCSSVTDSERELGRRGRMLRELARARNDLARSLGYVDYVSLAWHRTELGNRTAGQVLMQVERETRRNYFVRKRMLDGRLTGRPEGHGSALRRAGWPEPEGLPQHVVAQERRDHMAAAVIAGFEGLGLPDVRLATLHWADPRPAEGQVAAYTKSIDRRGDVRIWISGSPAVSLHRVLAHELAHAAYDLASLRGASYLLRTAPHPLVSEGLSQFIEWCSRSAQWRDAFSAAASSATSIAGCMRARDLASTRQLLVRAAIERALYADPGADLDSHYAELTQRMRGLVPGARPRSRWAAETSLVTRPLSAYTYLLGRRVCGQFFRVTAHATGGWRDLSKVGEALLPLLRQGATRPWEETLACWTRDMLQTCTR